MQISQTGFAHVKTHSATAANRQPLAVNEAQAGGASGLPTHQGGQIVYERHLVAGQKAISSYLLTQHSTQREAISSAVGIDTYA